MLKVPVPAINAPAITHKISIALWTITFLFLCRVLGQFSVYFLDISWLPPFSHWYSGLLEYQYLLPAQCLIFLLLLGINRDISRRYGFFSELGRKATIAIRWVSYVYASSMVVRYVITMVSFPERRWFGEGTIPITFHLLLALYLYLYSEYLSNNQNTSVQ
jgi:hypothetical protein